jgi:small subunit ribosomal protein S8e
MTLWHGEKGKKLTGGIIHLSRKKRKYELGSLPVHTKIGKEKRKFFKTKGGGLKVKSFSVEFANVLDTKSNVTKKVKILDVIENPANPHLARSGIITKGAVIKTEIGNAKVTSRPSQHGIVNALMVDSQKKSTS